MARKSGGKLLRVLLQLHEQSRDCLTVGPLRGGKRFKADGPSFSAPRPYNPLAMSKQNQNAGPAQRAAKYLKARRRAHWSRANSAVIVTGSEPAIGTF